MPVIVGVEPIKGLIFDQKIDTQWGDMTRIKLNQYLASLEAIPRREQQEEKSVFLFIILRIQCISFLHFWFSVAFPTFAFFCGRALVYLKSVTCNILGQEIYE